MKLMILLRIQYKIKNVKDRLKSRKIKIKMFFNQQVRIPE